MEQGPAGEGAGCESWCSVWGRVGTITLNPAKHTALGHALRKKNSLDKTYYILCVCSSLCLKKTSNYFICSQREEEKKAEVEDEVM